MRLSLGRGQHYIINIDDYVGGVGSPTLLASTYIYHDEYPGDLENISFWRDLPEMRVLVDYRIFDSHHCIPYRYI
jgi:hypothetical protein